MQEQKSVFRSLSDVFDLEHGSSSISSETDLSLHWNNNVNPEQPMDLSIYALPTNESSVVHPATVRSDGNSLSIWSPGQPSYVDEELQLRDSEDENNTSMFHRWNGNASPSFRLDEGQYESSNILPAHNRDGYKNEAARILGTPVNFLAENENNEQNDPFDDQHFGLKRKAVEGSSGESSYHGNPGPAERFDNKGPGHVDMYIDPSQESFDQRNDICMGSALADTSLPESSERNTRLRTSPFYWHDSASYNIWGPVSTAYSRQSQGTPSQMLPGYCPVTGSSSSRSSTEDAGTSQAPNLSTYPRGAAPYPAVGLISSSIPTFSAGSSSSSMGGTSASLVEGTSRIPSSTGNQMSQLENEVSDLTREVSRWNRNIADGSRARNIASSSLASSGPRNVHPSPSLSLMAYQDSLERRANRLSAVLNQTISTSSTSESGLEDGDVPLIRPTGSAALEQQLPLSSRLRHRYVHLRSRLPNDRHGTRSGIQGLPLGPGSSTSSLDWSRLTSQIRNLILARARNGDNVENLRLEDMIRSQSIFYGMDLHDRHRDMRLDVDNMSYEELLALEERIGNVSTGISEETVSKYLKLKKYVSFAKVGDQEIEPCCICREDYLESEELGTLDCGHDFHSACIKQWLMVKNLCPICKTTGLAS